MSETDALLAILPVFHGTGAKLADFLEAGAKAGKRGKAMFSPEKIGSGQGAASYGHGHYFAENPEVATQYFYEMGGDPIVKIGGKTVDEFRQTYQLNNKEFMALQHVLSSNRRLRGETVKGLREQFANKPELLEGLKSLERMGLEVKQPGGRMNATLDVEPEELLDLDLPLNQQPEKVKEALRQADWWDYMNDELESAGMNPLDLDDSAYTGEDLLGRLRAMEGEQVASEMLRELGVPGLRYFDQGSRTVKQGPRNIVMFPGTEDRIHVTHWNDQVIDGDIRE
jgi:hypothetical protein